MGHLYSSCNIFPKHTYLDIMFSKLVRQRSPSGGQRIDSIIYCYLAILFIQELVYVLSAFFDDLLSQEYRGSGRCFELVNGRKTWRVSISKAPREDLKTIQQSTGVINTCRSRKSNHRVYPPQKRLWHVYNLPNERSLF